MPTTVRLRQGLFAAAYLGLCLALGAAALVPSQAPAQQAGDEVRFRITNPKMSRFKLALPRAAGDAAAAAVIQEVMSNDLTLSGFFQVLDPASFLPEPPGSELEMDPTLWRQVNAEGVLKAMARRNGGGIALEIRLYEVVHGSAPELLKTLYGAPTPEGARVLAHHAAAEVVRFFTNEDSFFLSQITVAHPIPPRTKEVAVMGWDGAGFHDVTHNGSLNILPSWHPSGASLLFTTFLRGSPQLYTIAVSGGVPRVISARDGINTGGVYSPDGTRIALTLSRDGNSEIYLLNEHGDMLKRLTNSPFIDTSPTWSPDGSRIAFVSSRYGSPQIFTMSASGAGQSKLTRRGNYNQEPCWAPRPIGGQSLIAFSARDEKGVFDIFTVNADSGEIVRLTENRGSNWHPTWAPNARAIAYASDRGGIWVATADGKTEKQVNKGPADAPSWGPNPKSP